MKPLRIFLILAVLSVIAYACEIPVFRYALERWKADPYRLKLVIPESGLTDQQKALVDNVKAETWKGGGSANLIVETVLGAKASFTLNYPEKSGILRPVREGELIDLEGMLESPARKKVQELILKGKSIVWLVVASGDAEKDKKFISALDERVSSALKKVKLSDAIIRKPDAQTQKKLTKAEIENILQSEIPLELSFAIVKLDRLDEKERFFIDMLMRQSPELIDHAGPAAFPVFGRGRVLEGLTDLEGESLETLTLYLSKNCSCTVKDENPGIDLLMNVPWQDYTANSTLQYRDVLPPISGVIEEEEAKLKAEEKALEAREEARKNPSCILKKPIQKKAMSLTMILGVAVGLLIIIILVAVTAINRTKSQ